MVTSPHHLASQTGIGVLRDGGSAVEAAVAMAATLAVVYPHMTGIGGDGFWLVARPNGRPIAIDASGAAGLGLSTDLYRRQGLARIPVRGPLAAITVAGTVSGWQRALELEPAEHPLPRQRLLRDAIEHAEKGIVVTAHQAEITARKREELEPLCGFAATYLPPNGALERLALLAQPALAHTLRGLSEDGFDSFYRGKIARAMADDLARVGSPLELRDLQRHSAESREPLSVQVRGARIFNLPPPTQGLASLIILALFDRLRVTAGEGFDHVHGLVEATKLAFGIRDGEVGDPGWTNGDLARLLEPDSLDSLVKRIDRRQAAVWPCHPDCGDTVWFAAVDRNGCAASVIQSLYFEYGSGIVLPQTGVAWQNRGSAFDLHSRHNRLRPGCRPLHTLNPAMARFDDGRQMVYGTMGGDGQPQTQAALFSRYAWFGMQLQQAVTAPRWLLGRTWGEESTSLKLEDRFDHRLYEQLTQVGHDIQLIEPFSAAMGHAGAIVRHPDGVIEGAADPRSDGSVAAC